VIARPKMGNRKLASIATGIGHCVDRAWRFLTRSTRWITAFSKGLPSFIVGFAGVVAILWLGALLIENVKRQSITISDISVPKDLAERGYTSTVAALRLRDALGHYTRQASARMQIAQLDLPGEQPVVVVPTLGLPLDVVANSTAHLLRIGGRRSVSGELTEKGKTLWLRLRLNDQVIFEHRVVANGSENSFRDADALFAAAAQSLFENSEPYIVAAHLANYENHVKAARDAATAIIDSNLPAHDENVIMAHVLLGLIFLQHRDYPHATSNLEQPMGSIGTTLQRTTALASFTTTTARRGKRSSSFSPPSTMIVILMLHTTISASFTLTRA
jgi:hypothetical protein